MKILSVIGARPQFVKAAIVSKKLRKYGIKEILVHTGQHYDYKMSDIFFQQLEMAKPDYNLGVGSGGHGRQTGRMLEELEIVLLKETPDMVLLYGDTNSTLAGSLAASKLHIPVAHVEAGLRSFNRKMPEELNRILTDHVSDYLFSPTNTGLKNLGDEGFKAVYHYDGDTGGTNCSGGYPKLPEPPYPRPMAVNVGDVMFDIALEIKKKVDEEAVLKRWKLAKDSFMLTTIHRPENTDNPANLESICGVLTDLAKSGKKIIFPVHPRTKKVFEAHGHFTAGIPENLVFTEPLSYMDILALESNARLIVTDSGGIQKEGYFFDTPCVIVREQSEWVELLEIGWNALTGADRDKIMEAVNHYWNQKLEKTGGAIFGNGDASDKIARILQEH